VDGTTDLPVSKTEVADFKAQQAKLAAERPPPSELQADMPVGMAFDMASLGVHGLEHFNGSGGMAVGNAGGQSLLDFGYRADQL
jgi:hypothetical protein